MRHVDSEGFDDVSIAGPVRGPRPAETWQGWWGDEPPVLLGAGEALFAGIDWPALGYEVTEHVPTESAAHIVLKKRA